MCLIENMLQMSVFDQNMVVLRLGANQLKHETCYICLGGCSPKAYGSHRHVCVCVCMLVIPQDSWLHFL